VAILLNLVKSLMYHIRDMHSNCDTFTNTELFLRSNNGNKAYDIRLCLTHG